MGIEEKRHGETAGRYAYRTLRRNIIPLDLEPGAPSNDVGMSQMIDISRTPMQEVVAQLGEESRVTEIFPQKRIRITLIDVELVEEAHFLYLVLEKAAVELICGQADEKDLRWLDENIRLQKFYLEGDSSQKPLELDNKMHRKLLSIYCKELTYEIRQRLTIHYDGIRNLSVVAVRDHKVTEDRKKLLGAIRCRDRRQAVGIMGLHLNRWMLNEWTFRNRYSAYLK